MKVGDLVVWHNVMNDEQEEIDKDYGVVVSMSRTGHKTHSAQVLFTDGKLSWFDTQLLEVVNEGR